MSMYGKNHYNIVISLQLIKIVGQKKLNNKTKQNTGTIIWMALPASPPYTPAQLAESKIWSHSLLHWPILQTPGLPLNMLASLFPHLLDFLAPKAAYLRDWAKLVQAPLSVEFSRRECWSGLPFPPPGNLPNPGIKPSLLHCRRFLYHLSHQGSPRLDWGARALKSHIPGWDPALPLFNWAEYVLLFLGCLLFKCQLG